MRYIINQIEFIYIRHIYIRHPKWRIFPLGQQIVDPYLGISFLARENIYVPTCSKKESNPEEKIHGEMEKMV